MHKNTRISLALAVLLLASLACGLIDSVTDQVSGAVGNTISGDTSFTATSQLWADVPRMDGFESSELEVPLMAKVLMQTMMSQFLAEGKGGADWIVFSTSNTTQAIQDFYSSVLVGVNGWESSDETTCFSGSDQGMADVGLFCVFLKQEGNVDTGLMLIAAPDEENAGKNNVFFIRIENRNETPTP